MCGVFVRVCLRTFVYEHKGRERIIYPCSYDEKFRLKHKTSDRTTSYISIKSSEKW